MKLKKRGLSEVVSTVMVIMLTVVALAAIAAFVIPFVRNSLQKSSECIGYEGYFSFDSSSSYSCNYNEGDNYLIGSSIKAKADSRLSENAEGFALVLNFADGTSKKLEVNSSLTSEEFWVAGHSGEEVYIPNGGETRTYVYNSSVKAESAEVYAVLKSGAICVMKDTIKLINCGSGVILE